MVLTGALQLCRGLLSSSSLMHVHFSSAFFCFVFVLSLSRSSVTVTVGLDYCFVFISGLTLVDYCSDLMLKEEFSVEISDKKTDKLSCRVNVAKYIA
ncbi:uncharacterized protein DS421_5g145860 [Arachis hypogaea]|nr:uncharacterized protein DS421_5g145860 [Arachis hypogaea]